MTLDTLHSRAVNEDPAVLSPSWALGEGFKIVRRIRELDTHRWSQVAGELASDLRRDVAHGCKHRLPVALEHCLMAALEASSLPSEVKPTGSQELWLQCRATGPAKA